MSITIKTVYNDDIRRMQLPVVSFDAVRAIVTSTYGSGPFQIRYVDEDDDFISISTTIELEEAVRVMNSQALKIFISDASPENVSPSEHGFVDIKPVDISELVQENPLETFLLHTSNWYSG